METEVVERIPLDNLSPSPHQHRSMSGLDGVESLEDLARADKALLELTESIRSVGVSQPIIVRPAENEGCYQIVCGERRWRASQFAEKDTIPAIVRDLSDEDAALLTLEENVERENLTPYEMARGIKTLIDMGGGDVSFAARKLHKSPSWVARRARIADLSFSWVTASSDPSNVVAGWGVSHLEVIAVLPRDQQEELWGEWQYSLPVRPTVEELQRRSIESLAFLSAAPWDLSSGSVAEDCPACNGCPNRTSSNPLLFAEMQDPAGDRCALAECWRKKQAGYLGTAIRELPVDGLLVMVGSYTGGDLPHPEAISLLEVEPCAVDEEWAVQCLYVDGTNAGKSFWGRRKGKEGRRKATPAELKERLHRRRVKRLCEIACNMLAPVDDGKGDQWTEPDEIDLELIPELKDLASLAAAIGTSLRLAEPATDWNSTTMNKQDVRSSWTTSSSVPDSEDKRVISGGAWGRYEYYVKNEDVLERDLWRQIAPVLAGRCTYTPQRDPDDLVDEVKQVFRLLGKDFSSRWSEVCAEIPEPSSWAQIDLSATE